MTGLAARNRSCGTTRSRSTYITYIMRSAVLGGKILDRLADCGPPSGMIPDGRNS